MAAGPARAFQRERYGALSPECVERGHGEDVRAKRIVALAIVTCYLLFVNDEEFLERWGIWKKALGPKDPNSLIQQLSSVCWNIAVHKAIEASWRTVTAEDGDTINMNRLLYHFTTNNFNKTLCLELRRLTDSGTLERSDPKGKDLSVFSLHSVLADLKKHREEFTRRRLFICRGIEYDLGTIRRRHDEWIQHNPRGGGFVPRELNEEHSRYCHVEWDRFCRLSANSRSPNDCIPLDYLNLLIREVVKMRRRLVIVDKYFAHAATPQSRAPVAEKDIVTPAELVEMTINCGRLVNSVSSILGEGPYPFLPNYAENKWEDWSTAGRQRPILWRRLGTNGEIESNIWSRYIPKTAVDGSLRIMPAGHEVPGMHPGTGHCASRCPSHRQ